MAKRFYQGNCDKFREGKWPDGRSYFYPSQYDVVAEDPDTGAVHFFEVIAVDGNVKVKQIDVSGFGMMKPKVSYISGNSLIIEGDDEYERFEALVHYKERVAPQGQPITMSNFLTFENPDVIGIIEERQ